MAKVKFGLVEGEAESGGGYEVTEAEITELLKRTGDKVQEGDVIMNVETQKAAFDILAPASGVITALYFEKDENWNKTGQETTDHGILYLPALGEIETGIGAEDLPDEIVQPEPVSEVAPEITEDAEAADSDDEPQKGDIISAVPAARELAREHGIDLRVITPTGQDGIITHADVTQHIAKQKFATGMVDDNDKAAVANWEGEGGSYEKEEDKPIIVKPSKFHMEMARRVAMSKELIPHAGDQTVSFNTTVLWRYLKKLKTEDPWFKARGLKPRLEHFIGYFAVELLKKKKFQILNGYWDKGVEKIVIIPDINIGFVVDATDLNRWGDERLTIPIVHNAETLSLPKFVEAVEAGIQRALSRNLTLADDRELTFSVNNTGVLGGTAPNSIIPITRDRDEQYRPTGMILNIGVVRQHLSGRCDMTLAFRFDHQLVSGKRVMAFAKAIAERVETFQKPEKFLDLDG